MPEPEYRSDDPRDGPDAARWFKGDAFRGVLTPVLAGLVVDLADLITFGPIGPWLGLLLGGLVGWQLAPRFGMAERPWLPALVAGVYCMTPGTALMPLATLLTSLMSFAGPEDASASEPTSGAVVRDGEPPVIEPEYRSSWDEDKVESSSGKGGAGV